MNYIMKHIFKVAIISLVLAVVYIIILTVASKDTAQAVGVVYISIIATASLIWDVTQKRNS